MGISLWDLILFDLELGLVDIGMCKYYLKMCIGGRRVRNVEEVLLRDVYCVCTFVFLII